MKITAISDLHGYYPQLPGGDLLIVAGDLTARDTLNELDRFNSWILEQEYEKKIVIAGNHDSLFQQRGVFDPVKIYDGNLFIDPGSQYLCDSGTEFGGLKIWGMPWTYRFKGINPKCCAFTFDEHDTNSMQSKVDMIPHDIDILITHGPPLDILDRTCKGHLSGCKFLKEKLSIIKPKLHVFGHIHENGNQIMDFPFGSLKDDDWVKLVNCSYVDENYRPRNKIMEIEI